MLQFPGKSGSISNQYSDSEGSVCYRLIKFLKSFRLIDPLSRDSTPGLHWGLPTQDPSVLRISICVLLSSRDVCVARKELFCACELKQRYNVITEQFASL